MKKYENEHMNYDENGLYKDEKPIEDNHPVASKIISTLVLIVFIGGIIGLFYFSQNGNGYMAVYSFFGIWLAISILGLLSDVIIEEKNPQQGLFVSLAIGILGMAGTRIVQVGDNQTRIKLLKIFCIGVAGFFIVLGIIHVIRKAKYDLSSKDNCTVPITAKCVSVAHESYSSNGQLKKYMYIPTYRYTYEDKEYTVVSGKTIMERGNDMDYEIFIDPDNPKVILDPDAEKKGIASVIISAVLWIGIPSFILIMMLYGLSKVQL